MLQWQRRRVWSARCRCRQSSHASERHSTAAPTIPTVLSRPPSGGWRTRAGRDHISSALSRNRRRWALHGSSSRRRWLGRRPGQPHLLDMMTWPHLCLSRSAKQLGRRPSIRQRLGRRSCTLRPLDTAGVPRQSVLPRCRLSPLGRRLAGRTTTTSPTVHCCSLCDATATTSASIATTTVAAPGK
ncbi:hypothetical protein SEVIR_9G302450v4 [Setaria viridis]|uniref:Uncharacterized protein n=1 Tax=Setaria viridis TaxID=4556 RepID=A0A4U6SZ97_SETVI|nr:hypothetical protein SEVIR_9G302450v2 [Setaria viridis]